MSSKVLVRAVRVCVEAVKERINVSEDKLSLDIINVNNTR